MVAEPAESDLTITPKEPDTAVPVGGESAGGCEAAGTFGSGGSLAFLLAVMTLIGLLARRRRSAQVVIAAVCLLSPALAQAATGTVEAEKNDDVSIPDYVWNGQSGTAGWTNQSLTLNAPAGATITKVYVEWRVQHSNHGDVCVALSSEQQGSS